MKRAKKLIAFLLAAVMVMSLSMTVLADSTGDLTIIGTTEGKTYDLYKVLDLTQSGDAYSYTVNTKFEGFF